VHPRAGMKVWRKERCLLPAEYQTFLRRSTRSTVIEASSTHLLFIYYFIARKGKLQGEKRQTHTAATDRN
jgi:hypothetical protein